MRTGAGFTPSFQSPSSAPTAHSAWHSPVPYLFGGLAAMLGLIAFALLILACSYWRLSGFLEGGDDSDHRDGDGKPADSSPKPVPRFEEGFVVIMAGDHKPTYIATPISSRAASLENGGKDTGTSEEAKENGVIGEGGDQTHRQDEGAGDDNQRQ